MLFSLQKIESLLEMYEFGRRKKTPKVKTDERKNIESAVGAASAQALRI
jgi:hypothetical protein